MAESTGTSPDTSSGPAEDARGAGRPPGSSFVPAAGIPAPRGPVWMPPGATGRPAPGPGTPAGGWGAPPHPGPTRSARPNPLAILSLVAGGVGLLLGLVPLVGLVAWPLVIAALVLGLIGLVRSAEAGGRGVAIAGVVVSVLGLVLCTASTSFALAGAIQGARVASSAASPATPGLARTSTVPGSVAPLVPSAPLGTAVAYPDGMEVTVSGPAPYVPSRYASVPPGARPFAVQVTIRNGTTETFAPTSTLTSASVGGVEAEAVYDSTGGVSGPPSTTILPGRSATFPLAFAAPATPGDLQVDVRPGYSAEPATFTGAW